MPTTYWQQATTNTLHTRRSCSVTRRTRYNHFEVSLEPAELERYTLCRKCFNVETPAPSAPAEPLEPGARYRDGSWLVEVLAVDDAPDTDTGGTVTVRVLEAPAMHRTATLGRTFEHRQRGHRSAFLPRYKRVEVAA